MNIEDIIHKASPARVSVNEMLFVVKEYIKDKKGRDIDINLEKNLPRHHPLFNHLYQNQLGKLNKAFSTASEYFIK